MTNAIHYATQGFILWSSVSGCIVCANYNECCFWDDSKLNNCLSTIYHYEHLKFRHKLTTEFQFSCKYNWIMMKIISVTRQIFTFWKLSLWLWMIEYNCYANFGYTIDEVKTSKLFSLQGNLVRHRHGLSEWSGFLLIHTQIRIVIDGLLIIPYFTRAYKC